MSVHQTHRWRGIVAVALLAGAVGLVAKRPFLLLVAVVGVVYAAYPRLTSPPEVELSIDRTLSETAPRHEAPVEVTVTVENTGDTYLPDVRLVDGIPPMLTVTDGTPRHAATLWPGMTTSFMYTVKAVHGSHTYEPATAIVRDLSGAYEVEAEVVADHTIECQTKVPAVPVRKQTTRHSFGPIVTDEGGSGIEFHQTREYRHGDAMSRIDWKRFARTGALTTVEFSEERAASVVLCLDGREAAYRATGEGEPHGVAYELAAAEQLLWSLLEERIYAGLAAIGREPCWLAPNVGDGHFREAVRLLSTHPTFSAYPPNGDQPPGGRAEQQVRELRRRLGRDDQVILVSPLSDGFIAETAVTMEAAGHAVTVVSPNVTATDTLGGRLTAVERRYRIRSLRESNIPVIDWSPDDALGTTLLHAEERWFR